jgi:PAS domain S-box-containing protein
MKKYCWELFHCNNYDCPVYQAKEYKCWLISGTHCRNEIQGNFLEKIEMCLPCEIFKANMEVTALEETLALVAKQVQELKGRVEERDRELNDINLELAIGSSEVYEALKEISSGNPYVRMPETSDLAIISKLKSMVNLTAVNLAEIIDLSHEFAIGLAEHFDVLHRVSKGDLTARVLGTSPVEILELLKKMTNETIESVDRSINERMKAEEALRESEAKYRLIVNQIPEAVFRGYADWSVDFFDRKIEAITGVNKEDFDSRRIKWIDLIVPEDIDCVKGAFVEALKSTKSYVKEYRIRTKTGERRWIQLRGQIFCDVQGKIEYISGVLFDITEIKQAEKVLRESEEKYRLLMDNASDAIVLTDIDGNLLEVNKKTEQLLGYKKEELLRLDFGQLFSPEELERTTTGFQEIVQLGSGCLNDSRLLTKSGEEVPVDLTASLVKYGGKTVMQSFFRDISRRKKTEEALRQKEQELRIVVNNIPAVVFKGYVDGTVDFFDDKLELITGYQKADFDSRRLQWSDLIQEEFVEDARKTFVQALKSNRSYVREYRIKNKKDKIIWVQERSHIICDQDNRIEYISGILFDITERKKAEEERQKLEAQLRQAQKMETIGTLAGGIAHDFNNILTAIVGFIELAQAGLEQLPASGEIRSDLEAALQASGRAKDLTRQILTFSRQVDQEQKPIQILAIVKESLSLLRASLPKTIDIRQHLDPRSGVILADPIQIHQILINLCTNACHAMQDQGGILEVRLEAVAIDGDFAGMHAEIDEGPYVRLTVSDTGCGMDQATLERIFDPFFTTKTVGNGTGLGLSVVHGIVKSLGGSITVYSELERGTTFQVYFPQYPKAAAPEAVPGEPVPVGQEHILFVDDEKQISQIGQRLLERLGYKITAKSSSLEALEIFRNTPDHFDLVITDLTMPQMTGLELAKELLRLRPDMPIILATGFSEATVIAKARKLGIRECIMKPLVLRELGKVIRRILDNR